MRGRTTFAIVLAFATTVFVPSLAQACSVCTAGREEENAAAFLLSTIFMSLLPLTVIGTIVSVLWWHLRKLDADDSRERAAGGDPTRGVGAVGSVGGVGGGVVESRASGLPGATPGA